MSNDNSGPLAMVIEQEVQGEKLSFAIPLFGGGDYDGDLSQYAKLESPAFSGTPTAPTPAKGSTDNQIANTEFVAAAIANAMIGDGGVEVVLDNAVPLGDGVASPGTSRLASRQDHVHPASPSTTADKLAIGRTISLSGSVQGSAVFDGSSDIDIHTTGLTDGSGVQEVYVFDHVPTLDELVSVPENMLVVYSVTETEPPEYCDICGAELIDGQCPNNHDGSSDGSGGGYDNGGYDYAPQPTSPCPYCGAARPPIIPGQPIWGVCPNPYCPSRGDGTQPPEYCDICGAVLVNGKCPNNHGGPDVTDDGTTEGGDSYYENGLWWYWDDDYDAYYSILE